jgi:hypothetical protein
MNTESKREFIQYKSQDKSETIIINANHQILFMRVLNLSYT